MARIVALFILVGIMVMPSFGQAKKYDLDPELAKLYNHYNSGDPAQDALNRTQAYRSLMSEYGVVFAPVFASPASTLGYNGFAFDLNYGFTSVNSKTEYWKYGINGDPTSIMQTFAFQFRKGLWFPLPGFEIAGGLKYLGSSHLYAPYFLAKFAINEGFFELPLPALAVRGGLARVMGSLDNDLTIASLDVSISKSVGLGGTVNFQPYVGYNYLIIITDSKVIDTTPSVDSLGDPGDNGYPSGTLCSDDDCKNSIVFDDQSSIGRHRVFFGAKFIYYVFSFSIDASMTLSGNSKDSAVAYDYISNQTAKFNVKDESSFQWSVGISLGLDW